MNISSVKYYSNRIWKIISPDPSKAELIEKYFSSGRIPWSKGYIEYKMDFIEKAINSMDVLNKFLSHDLPSDFAKGIDERGAEYPWIFSKLSSGKTSILDAGSTFNYPEIINNDLLSKKDLTIATFFPESNNFYKKRISYVFSDLRELPFRDNWFDEVVCQSTIEHIDMDNSIYGYDMQNKRDGKSFEYMKAVQELVRVVKPNGKLLLTFPFGKYEYHGFFQQFDSEMFDKILNLLENSGIVKTDFLKYEKAGWRFAQKDELLLVESFNPHTGKGKGNDGAAHCRSIACVEFIKNK